MDPLSIASGVLTVLGVIKKIVVYVDGVKDYTDDNQKLITQMTGLQILLEALEDRLKDANEEDPWFKNLLKLATLKADGTYQPKAKGVLARLELSCKKLAHELEPRHGVKQAWSKAIWPVWTKAEIEEQLVEIDRLRQIIDQILNHDAYKLSQGIQKGMKTQEEDRERKDIIAWLSPLEFRRRQDEIFDAELVTGGKWLMKTEEFEHWSAGRPWYLCCYGNPGAGKVRDWNLIHLAQSCRQKWAT